MNAGKWIVVSFILFAIFIATLVSVCMRQDVNLVAKDYYKEELNYQSQIKRVANAALLQDKPEVSIQGSNLVVRYTQLSSIESGEIKLFRPSDENLDKMFLLLPSKDSVQQFNLNDASKGLYRAKLRWTMNDKEYFLEKILVF